MKKILLAILCICFLLSATACKSEDTEAFEKSDAFAQPFLEALVSKSNEEMLKYIHPTYADQALPTAEFYSELAENHFFKPNKPITAITAVGKSYITNTEVDGELLECAYLIFYNELYYEVKLLVLENDMGYGIISSSMELNLDSDFYI